MHVGVACQRPDLTVSVAASRFVFSGDGPRLLTEHMEVVGGLTAVAGTCRTDGHVCDFRGGLDVRLRRCIS